MIRLSKNQWAILLEADKHGGLIPFHRYKKRSTNALIGRRVIYRSDLGFKLTDEGLTQVNLKKMSDANRNILEDSFFDSWQEYGNEATIYRDVEGEGREHVYIIPNNKARFDFVFPQYKVAVEVQGGTWVRGGHSRGKGQTRDATKSNLAAAQGWQTLIFTSDMLAKDGKGCIDQVLDVMAARARYALPLLLNEAYSVSANPLEIRLLDMAAQPYLTISAEHLHFKTMLDYVLDNFLWHGLSGQSQLYSPHFTGSKNLLAKQRKQYEDKYGEIGEA